MLKRRLQLEELAARILPSATPLTHTAPPGPAPIIAPLTNVQTLTGQGQGKYSYSPIISGAGPQDRLNGTGYVAGLGNVSITGSLHGVGFIRNGHAGGELTFRNRQGSLTVDLQGASQLGFSPLPKQFSYDIVGGTGAYANMTGQGTLTLVLTPAPVGPRGTFTLSL